MNELEILCNKINEVAKNYVGDKEYIDDNLANDAWSYIKLMNLKLPGDYLVFMSLLNLLNSYVKQPDAKLGYSFKRELDYLLTKCTNENIDFIKFNKEDNLYIIKISTLEFSFHYVKLSEGIEEHFDKSLTWDGIRKQPCALTIYNLVKESNIEKSKQDFLEG